MHSKDLNDGERMTAQEPRLVHGGRHVQLRRAGPTLTGPAATRPPSHSVLVVSKGLGQRIDDPLEFLIQEAPQPVLQPANDTLFRLAVESFPTNEGPGIDLRESGRQRWPGAGKQLGVSMGTVENLAANRTVVRRPDDDEHSNRVSRILDLERQAPSSLRPVVHWG